MANIRTCNKHNMIACVEKSAHNVDFYQIIDYLTGCSSNYSLLVDPDLIGPWLQQFWDTASLRIINEVPHIRAMVAGKRVLISEETIRADLLFDDADGVDCFPKQVIWDSLRDIGYEGNLAQLTFSKPLFSPQWKYLVHVLLHCLSPKSTSWEQFGTNIASALVGLATNQKFNFSLMIMNGMLGHIANGKPFLMYPRFIQLFLNKQLEGVTRPQNFIPSVTLPSKVFTFMRKHSPKFSCQITPLTPPMLEVVTTLAAKEAHSESTYSRAASSPRDAQGTPTQSADLQGTAEPQVGAQEANYFQAKTDSQAQGQTQETVKRGTASGRTSRSLGKSQNLKKKKNEERSKRRRCLITFVYEDVICSHKLFVTPDLERKSDETEEVLIEEEKDASDVKSGDTEELDLERIQSTARQSTVTPRTLNFDDETGPSSPIRPTQEEESEEQFKDDEFLADLNRTRGLSIPEPKKKKLTLQQIRALETTNDEEVARKVQAEWDAEEERKKFCKMLRKSTNERKQYIKFKNPSKISLQGFISWVLRKGKSIVQERDANRLIKEEKTTVTEEQPSKKLKLRTETIDELRNYLRIVDFEQSAQDRESLNNLYNNIIKGHMTHPDGLYLINL
ncbi:hypothetical protein Tco_0045770 [Tanacetum coccineum]